MENLKFTCPCHFGLEGILSNEVKRLGAENIVTTDGRVSFTGDYTTLIRANLSLRTAERVLIVLGEFKATTFDELFEGVKALPFEKFIGKKDAFPVKGHSINSKLYSIPDCQSIIKKAAVNRLKEKYHIEWFEETGALFQIQFSIHKDNVAIMIDSSGVGLHKRGYRRKSNIAPIKETLAAGIVDLARVRPNSTVCDPFCGSGTFMIEAAYRALNIAPGLKRRFIAQDWQFIPEQLWQDERQRALSLIRRDAKFKCYGYDIDGDTLELSMANAKKAGVASRIRVENRDIKDFTYNEDQMIVICNPPYGERMLEIKEAEGIYSTMGKVFDKTPERSAYVISPHEGFENIFGKKADRRRKLYNGMIKCQLYMYFK
ncbi:MAG: class I SAM-dependent RNA methyltransferase [Clostridiales bacterium]|nr:class I SAM-dependent RNA methyltransferase [Clostridiales bacterium]